MKKIVLSLLVLTSVANTHINVEAMETQEDILTENCNETELLQKDILTLIQKSKLIESYFDCNEIMDSAKDMLSKDLNFTKFKDTLLNCKDLWMAKINILNAKNKMTDKQLALYRREAAIWTLKQVEYLENFFKDKQKPEDLDAFLSRVEVLRNTVNPQRIETKIMKQIAKFALPVAKKTKDHFLGVYNTAAQSFKQRLFRKQVMPAVNPVKASQAPATQPAPAVNPA